MSFVDPARASVRITRNHVTSRLGRAHTLHGVVQSIADEATNEHIPFDYCCLYLPASGTSEAQVWRAARTTHKHEEQTNSFDELGAHFAGVMRDRRAVFLGENELHGGAADAIGVRVRSALALPLTDERGCLGALCFTSRHPEAYTEETILHAEWLTEPVARAVRFAMSRAAHQHHTDETAHESRRLKQYFVRTLVREVRLPLSGVLSVLKTLESKFDAGEPVTATDRQLLGAAIEHCESVCVGIDDHLEVAQDGEHAPSLDVRQVSAAKLVTGTVETIRAEAALNGVGVDVHVAPDTPELVVDERQAARLLMHVLDAALVQTHEGGRIWVEAHGITGRRVEDGGRRFCRIDITEDGAGLPPEEVAYIFDAFRPSQPTSRNSTNSNIGLAIARRIAIAHGGNISARSGLGVGTIYSITLPAAS